jgi:hypothetical protein
MRGIFAENLGELLVLGGYPFDWCCCVVLGVDDDSTYVVLI